MRLRRSVNLLLAVLLLFVCQSVPAQDAVPLEILQRTFFIKVGNEAGTAFAIDHEGKIFLVTARHVVGSLPEEGAVIQIMRSNKWEDYKTVRTLFPAMKDVDIAVLETPEKVTKEFEIKPAAENQGPTMGQQLWFLGFPWGLESHFKNGELAFIKKGTMSAVDATDPDAIVLYIDGFNNPGFSGGPIVYWDFAAHVYRICGVVKGYKQDSAKAMVNGVQVDTNILVNSGILVGYSIKHALQAIEGEDKKSQ